MKKWWLISVLCLCSFPASADLGGFTYHRSQANIVRTHLKLDPSLMPWQQKQAIESNKLGIEVEVRDGRSLYQQEGWFNLAGLSDNTGIMMLFDEPSQPPIIPMSQYAPTDILFLDKEGKIIQIVPSIQLSELEQEIVPSAPIIAFLFLRAGICEKLVIEPGDSVEYGAFKKSPVILEDAPKTQPVILRDEPRPSVKRMEKQDASSPSTERKMLEKLYPEQDISN